MRTRLPWTRCRGNSESGGYPCTVVVSVMQTIVKILVTIPWSINDNCLAHSKELISIYIALSTFQLSWGFLTKLLHLFLFLMRGTGARSCVFDRADGENLPSRERIDCSNFAAKLPTWIAVVTKFSILSARSGWLFRSSGYSYEKNEH